MPENPYQPPKEMSDRRPASPVLIRWLVIGLSIPVTMGIWGIGFLIVTNLFMMIDARPWAFFAGCAIVAAIPALAFQYVAVQSSQLLVYWMSR